MAKRTMRIPAALAASVKDHLGSVRLVVDGDTGEVVQELDYGPFGEVLVDTNPGFQPFVFAGGLFDSETGLVRFGARDYDAEVGRWTRKDPVGFGGGQANLYVYVGDDPVNFLDLSGLEKPKLAEELKKQGKGEAKGLLKAACGYLLPNAACSALVWCASNRATCSLALTVGVPLLIVEETIVAPALETGKTVPPTREQLICGGDPNCCVNDEGGFESCAESNVPAHPDIPPPQRVE